MSLAFDADVLIYAAIQGNPLGAKVRALLLDETLQGERLGSTLLIPELLIKPQRTRDQTQLTLLIAYLQRLELLAASRDVANLAVQLGAAYGLKPMDALHLATAVQGGADQFLTNNRKDFKKNEVLELTVIYPDELP